jgi:MFS family permease
VFRREYLRYYLICAVFGGRKQIMLVYSPWVLIDLLDFKADTISILAVIGSLIGIFFMPIVGKWIDYFGVRRVMTAEALAFIGVYIAYGFLSKWVNTNVVVLTGAGMMCVYLLNIVDRMSAQFSMVRSIYMRSLALVPEDVTPSLTLGMAIDHVVAIVGSYICGLVWFRWGPEFVFLIAGSLSLINLIAAQGIKENY